TPDPHVEPVVRRFGTGRSSQRMGDRLNRGMLDRGGTSLACPAPPKRQDSRADGRPAHVRRRRVAIRRRCLGTSDGDPALPVAAWATGEARLQTVGSNSGGTGRCPGGWGDRRGTASDRGGPLVGGLAG